MEWLHIRVTRRVKEKLEKMAKEDGVTVSDLVRDAIRGYLQARSSMGEYLTPVERLIKDCYGVFGFDPERLYRLAKERGLTGDKKWPDKGLVKVLKIALDEAEEDLFGEEILDDTINVLGMLGVSKERIEKILMKLKGEHETEEETEEGEEDEEEIIEEAEEDVEEIEETEEKET